MIITITVSEDEKNMINRVCNKRKCSLRHLILEFIQHLDYEDEKKERRKRKW